MEPSRWRGRLRHLAISSTPRWRGRHLLLLDAEMKPSRWRGRHLSSLDAEMESSWRVGDGVISSMKLETGKKFGALPNSSIEFRRPLVGGSSAVERHRWRLGDPRGRGSFPESRRELAERVRDPEEQGRWRRARRTEEPQKPEDIDHLKKEENVAYILCLQQDSDVEYWEIELHAIIKRCKELGVRHMRRPAADFDPDSLRSQLPKAVSSLEWALSEGKGRVYVHCTAGLGRAPAVAIAYMFWFCDMDLNTTYDKLTSKRPCGPNKRAIQGATYDLAKNDPWKEPFENLPGHAFTGIADWERVLIQDRVRKLRGT